VAMGGFGFAEESVEGLHKLMILLVRRCVISGHLRDVVRRR
jgi:hypothetical protein